MSVLRKGRAGIYAALLHIALMLLFSPVHSALMPDEDIAVLKEGSYGDKSDLVISLPERPGAVSLLPVLQVMLDGDLYLSADEKLLSVTDAPADQYLIIDIDAGTESVVAEKGALKRVRINNSVRRILRRTIAQLQLRSDDVGVRLAAVKQIIDKVDTDSVAIIREYFPAEQDADVRDAMALVLAVGDLRSGDPALAEAAIETLSTSLEPVALNTLQDFSEDTDSTLLARQAEKAIEAIQGRVRVYENLETLYFGLSSGSVLVLAGIGLAITFGVMGVINMAHGELIMLGAYTTYVIQQLMPELIGISIIIAIPAAFLVSGLAGIIMERLVIRHLYGNPLETLLATFGISLILQQTVRTIFSPLNKSVITPDWMSGLLEVNSVLALTWNRLYIIVFCLIVFLALVFVMKKTPLGLQVRAVSQNRNMARAMGVRSQWVDALTFGLGSGIAGVAGVALSLITNVGPNLGQAYIIDSFMVVVFGGVGNLLGTLFAGMSLGVMNKVLEPSVGAVLAKILILVFIILFIQKRPQGLFPQRGRAAEG
ncbi:MAG: urea ABC transporter permease subunit UrtB [Gammaproteobacteria bacterium]|nr:urea ABC transporter permease subunit UrtB [Gammaproteobacteria bacterium]MBQ0774471.1 urea ABC transporter permease subunit UrtB [Gammaproteobacteria bacterium]